MTILPTKRSAGANSEESKETVQQTVCSFITFTICIFCMACHLFHMAVYCRVMLNVRDAEEMITIRYHL